MRTRVIQDQPYEPGSAQPPPGAPRARAPRRNVAARMARWSAQHRKQAILGWMAFAVLSLVFSMAVPLKTIVFETSGPGESGRADTIIYEEFRQPASEDVLVQSDSLTVEAPAFRAAVKDVVAGVSSLADVATAESPFARGNEGFVSADRRSALVRLDIRGPADDASDKIGAVVDRVAEVQRAHPELHISSFGESTGKALEASFGEDLKQAGLLSIPLTLIVLLIAFGALVAAGIPLLLGLTAVFATLGLVAGVSQVLPMSDSVSALILLVGLAVGVDYSLFYLKREREERAAGRSEQAALEAAAATSGRSVLISGSTVLVAMAGMFFTADATFASFGVATMAVVAVAMLGSLTVLPALLSKLGDRVERGRVPFLGRRRDSNGQARVWGAIVDRVMRRPLMAVLLAGGLLVAIALPATELKTAQPSIDSYPQELLGTYNRIKEAFPGAGNVSTVVLKAPDVAAPAVREAVTALRERALATGVMHEPIDVASNPAGTVSIISIASDGDGTDTASGDALTALRDDVIPATLGAVPGTDVAVTGTAAYGRDFGEQMRTVAPLVFGFVLLFAFGLMLVSFRSVVIAAKAVLLNLLSVGAAYGALVLVFQHGWGKGLLGFEFTGGIDPFLPILLFVILFGLSMDYHVFILSRVREAYLRGVPTDLAVAHAIKSTAGVVTSAALVMVGVFAIFATLQTLFLKQFGVGLAVAILLDATIVRAVLLPATMKLLGEWNWYLPRWLEWLPNLEHGGAVAANPVLPTAIEPGDERVPVLEGSAR